MRSFECPLCFGLNVESHILRKCKKFIEYKKPIRSDIYISNKLNNTELKGFCSAGIIPYYYDKNNKINILSLYETRKEEIKINFIGGGRESYKNKNNILYMETPYQTVINELTEELSELVNKLSLERFRELVIRRIHKKNYKIMWYGKNKMMYYIIEVPMHFKYIIENTKINQNVKINGLEWIKLDELVNNKFNEIHNYTKDVVNEINNLFYKN
jgi:hypothetical protein